MPSKEQGGVPSPESPNNPGEQVVYLRAAHFIDGPASQQAYMEVQSTLRTTRERGEGWNLAGYHLTSQEDVNWYVAVAGQQPSEALAEQLATALAAGVPTTLPDAFHDLLIRHNQITPASTMTFDEWLAADERSGA